jgi:hypothetical protein
MPANQNQINVSGEQILTTLPSASYQINGGSVIAGGTQTADAAAFTDTVTVTGLVATDSRIGVKPRDAVVIPAGLAIVSIVAGAGTVAITWRNITQSAITPPAAGVWSVAVFGNYLK